MNILSLLETDFVEICLAIIHGNLDKISVRFRHQASVCKYVVPEGYPRKTSAVGTPIDAHEVERLPDFGTKLRMYFGAVNQKDDSLCLTDSRSLALVGIADTMREAEQIAETGAGLVKGKVFHRHDIGTSALIQKRIDHMERIRGGRLQRRTA